MFLAAGPSLERLLEKGSKNYVNRYKRRARIIRSGVSEMCLKLLVDNQVASNSGLKHIISGEFHNG